ncbi:hypothetical protein KHA80_05260 [Anaerobacillus sp. HL2]|nr:hypothetical protein KHA80_05260 [Anaerobacillus sp. HL2]
MIEEKQADRSIDTLPTLYGDETQFLQLFQNLIQNGLKFQKDHKIRSILLELI